jgi:hypothetical protein
MYKGRRLVQEGQLAAGIKGLMRELGKANSTRGHHY